MSSFDFDQLTADKVSRHYGRQRALTRVSLSVRAGEIIGLLGPNGAGKSTLLGILATLIAPSSGSVRYGDRSVRALGSALRQRIGFLSHDLQLYPELTARENLEFFARLYGVSTPESMVNEALDCARLVNRADDPIVGFSRGMRQRLALERALLHEPRLVLLDEPFTGLDDRSIDDLAERLRALGRSDRIVIFATHDLDIAEKVLDRAIVLRNGRMGVLSDSGGTLRDRYRGFLANTNEQQRNLAGG